MKTKFRVWDKNIPANTSKKELDKPTGMMIPWEYVKDSTYLVSALNGKYPIMLFTGLKDFNNKEMYDGDVILIHWSTGSDIPEIISYDEKYGYWKYGNNPICELIPDKSCDGHKFEIIGNIYKK